MSFMVPVVESEEYYSVDCNHGETHIVPVSASGIVQTAGELQQYVEGEIDDPDAEIVPQTGFICQMTAPGYLDQTDWSAFETEVEAWEYLLDEQGNWEDEHRENWEFHAECRIVGLKGEHVHKRKELVELARRLKAKWPEDWEDYKIKKMSRRELWEKIKE